MSYSALINPAGAFDEGKLPKPAEKSSCAREFEPGEQSRRLFREQAPRLLITTVIVGLFIAILKIFENKGNIGHTDVITFNVIITVLSLALGLNFLEAFKDMAKVLRWRILANREFTVRQADLILGGESLMNLVTLMWESHGKPLTLFVCASWIALNLLAQASIAMLGLTYSIDGGLDSSSIITSNGTVHVSLLDHYYDYGPYSTGPGAPPEIAQNQAHAYGEITRGEKSCPYKNDHDIESAAQNCTYFYDTSNDEFAFRYSEYNPQDRARSYPYLTNRIVRASAGECYQYNVDSSRTYAVDGPDGNQEVWVFIYYNETYNGTIQIPKPSAAYDSTTYIYDGTHVPQNATAQACGPRCLWIYAFQNWGPIMKRPNRLFKCGVTIGNVSNVDSEVQALPNDNARLAAASIALSGRYTNPNGSVDKEWQQYQLYPYGSYWESQGLSPQSVGARMSEFAIGSLAAMANLNPQTLIPGTLPTLGRHLSIQWKYVIALASCIAGVHCILVGLILLIARPIVVGADSNLVTARILQGLVKRLEGRGALLDGREIADAIEKKGTGGVKVVYGVEMRDVGRVVELGEEMEVRSKLPGGRFPGGLYA